MPVSLPLSAPTEVRIANALTTARHTYSEAQLNLLFCLLTKLRKEPVPDRTYTLTLAELSILMRKQLNAGRVENQARAMQTSCWYYGPLEKPQPLWLFERVAYRQNQGSIEFTLSPESLPFLFQLTARFTSFNLDTALQLRSNYSKRLYLLCARWRDRPATPVYSLPYLKWMLALTADASDAPDKYRLFGHFNSRILQPALTRLSALTDLKVKLAPQKRGRAVTGIKLLLRAEPAAPQPVVATPLPSADSATDRRRRAAAILLQLGIVAPPLHQAILASEELIAQTYKFSHDLKTDKIRIKSNAGGFLLKKLGLISSSKKR